MLEIFSTQARLQRLIELLETEIEKRQLDRTIQTRVKRQMEKAQKEYYLNEQIKAIHKELGRKDEKAELEDLKKKWEAFGWHAIELNGHNIDELIYMLRQVPHPSGRPLAVIANTVKGKGVSFMEDDNNWHYRIPTADEVVKARKELGLA